MKEYGDFQKLAKVNRYSEFCNPLHWIENPFYEMYFFL